MSQSPIDLSEFRIVPAAPATVYDLISDITQMSRFSPETVSTSWLDGASAAAVGARFSGVNTIGKLRWTTKPTVTAAEPGRRFAFRVPSGAAATWTYTFEPVEGGTLVTESVRSERVMPAAIRAMTRLAGVRDREAHLRAGMATTLSRLATAAVAAESSTRTR